MTNFELMTIQEITQVPFKNRDEKWENSFFQKMIQTKFRVLSPDPQLGPDQWPYLMVEISENGTESPSQIIRWLADRGIGLVINPQKDYPDYVFTYGMIWHFKNTGYFYKSISESSGDQQPQKETIEYTKSSLQHAGDASEEYLPKEVRKILKDFLRDQGVLSPKILVMSLDRKLYDLSFSLESLGNPPESEHSGIAEALSWFLPPHYSIVLISEIGLPPFFNL